MPHPALINHLVRGYCPSIYSPMASRDGWLVRMRAPLNGFTARQGLFLSRVAQKYCDGLLQLTSRANIQLRVTKQEDIKIILRAAIDEGLIYPDQACERRLNIIINPHIASKAPPHSDTLRCGHMLRQLLLTHHDLDTLNPKFGFVVDGGMDPNVNCLYSDVTIRYQPQNDEWFVQCGDFRSGACSWHVAARIAVQLAQAFVVLNWMRRPVRCAKETKYLFEKAGVKYTFCPYDFSAKKAYLRQPLGQLAGGFMGVHVPFGQLSAALLKACCSLLSKHSHKPFFLTPWQGLIFPDIKNIDFQREFVVSEDDPRLRIFACPGQGGCPQALGKTYDLIPSLLSALPHDKIVHVSACTKGCVWPHRADYTIVAQKQGYGLIYDGDARQIPDCFFAKPCEISAMFT